MSYKISKLTQENAEKIAAWPFSKDYQWTVLGKGSENEYYLLRENYRKDYYFQIEDDNKFLGYFAINNRIRKEAAALQIVIDPEADEKQEKDFVNAVADFVKENYPDVISINVMAYSYQTKAIKVFEELGFENHGVLSSFGHDMSSYEEDGFNVNEKGEPTQEISLIVLDKVYQNLTSKTIIDTLF